MRLVLKSFVTELTGIDRIDCLLELIKLIGRMRFRSSYGQNLLQHSREVAKLCATMAAELGLNAKHAKRAGLLHDIGKVWPEEPEMPHALLGMDLAKKYNENKEVCNAIGAHHDEVEMTSMISPTLKSAASRILLASSTDLPAKSGTIEGSCGSSET